ncbi:MAG: ferredoxin--NADP reductase [Hyphomicrobium sp.]
MTEQTTTRPPVPANLYAARVEQVRHYTDKLFAFTCERPTALRFRSGEFLMIGLMNGERPLLRAYSIASPAWDDRLSFYSIKVPDGPLTSRLQHIKPGATLLFAPKPTGSLLIGNLRPGRRLFLMATGTGFAPFASLLRDPEIYERFESVVLVYGCRQVAELTYATKVTIEVREHELLAELAAGKLDYYATVTREAYHHEGRITDLIRSQKLFRDLGAPPLSAGDDRVMICGNPEMTADLRRLLGGAGFVEGNSTTPGDFVVEKAFVDR